MVRRENTASSTICVVDARPADYLSVVTDPLSEGVNFRFFHTGRAALRDASLESVRLWVINMNLPDLDGDQLQAMLRSRFPDVPVYLVSDEYDFQQELSARQAGATMYLCKPIESEWLTERAVAVA